MLKKGKAIKVYDKVKRYLASRMMRAAEKILVTDISLNNTFPDGNISLMTFRSDNGSQMTSPEYETHLKACGIYHETTHPYSPEEDGHIESFFGHFKEDYIYSHELRSFKGIRGLGGP